MGRAALVYVDLEVGPAPHQGAGRGGVVEVDMGQQQRPRALVAERLEEGLQRGLRPRVDQRVADLPAADHVRPPEVHDVYDAHRGRPGDQAGVGEGKRSSPSSVCRMPSSMPRGA